MAGAAPTQACAACRLTARGGWHVAVLPQISMSTSLLSGLLLLLSRWLFMAGAAPTQACAT